MASGPAATTHGFLFADLRDYARFVETRGDQAAVELLSAYRSLVREVVERFGGAEIRTEGDSFYIVFPSASSAVEGGLAVLQAATAATERDPAHPVHVGVGVHAGETADGVEGYVGSAVNIAARVCAQAAPGELLVTDTVRSLTRSRLAVGFLPRGTPRLKGIEEPIALFAVTPVREMPGMGALRAPVPARAWARLSVPRAAAAIVLVAVLAIGGALTALNAQGPSATPSPSVPVASVASVIAEVASPTPTPVSTAFPTGAEATLIKALPIGVGKTCVRGPYATVFGGRDATPLASLSCPLPISSGANDVLIRQFKNTGLDAGRNGFTTDAAIPNPGGKLKAGACATATAVTGRWSLAGVDMGAMACYIDGSTGDAVIWWSYKDLAILVEATNHRGDTKALYGYFEQIARFITP